MIILADRQDITRIGIATVARELAMEVDGSCVTSKCELLQALKDSRENTIVVLDYTLFDIHDASELLVLVQRFLTSHWLLFSDELSRDFVRFVVSSSQQVSILLKDSSLDEICCALVDAARGQQYVCQQAMEFFDDEPQAADPTIDRLLTRTEREVLRDIALGMTTRDIAERRYSSFHTINTHRKNIFRKLGVNNAHEATRYALRAGIVDTAEYFI